MSNSLTWRILKFFIALLGVTPLVGNAQAQDGYPNRPIRIIVSFPAGSSSDLNARRIAQFISGKTGQPAVVDNRPGANGFLACQAAARAAPDGYTLLLTSTTTHAANPALYKKLPYDPIKDFAPVGRVGQTGMVMVVPTDSPIRSVNDLTHAARSQPGKLSYGSANASSRIAVEMYKTVTGTDLVNIPYKGIPQGLQDLIAQRLDLMIADIITTLPLVQRGALRALAVTTPQRNSKLPNVPTLHESGFAGFAMTTWTGVFAPAGTPRPIIDRVSQLLRGAVMSAEVSGAYAAVGAEATPSSPDELAVFVRDEIAKWSKAVKAAGIEPE